MSFAVLFSDTFPARVKLTEKRVAWVEAEVQAWIAARIASNTPLVER